MLRWVVMKQRVGFAILCAGWTICAWGQVRTAATEKTLVDRYCITCHNDKAKTANLSLQRHDLAKAGDEPEVWEKVIRKLRAGLMPPPGMPRPALADYEGLR